MVTREQLKIQGLRAYEAGRLKVSARVTFVLIPLAALCLWENQARETCACLAVVLFGLAMWLRWRNREGVESVTTGLVAGSVPLVFGLGFDRFGLTCGFGGGASFCTGFALLAGGAAGAYIGTRENGWHSRGKSLVAAAAVATLAASLGCVRLGAVGLAAVIAGIGLGSVLTVAVKRR